MQVYVRSTDPEVDEAVRAHIARRLQFSLGRFSDSIGRVNVRVVDINGPRGGEDKACRIEVRLRPNGTVFVQDTDAVVLSALDRAADRTARAVARAPRRNISRRRAIRRGQLFDMEPLDARAAFLAAARDV